MQTIFNWEKVDDSPLYTPGDLAFDAAGLVGIYLENTGAALDAHEAAEVHEDASCRPTRVATTAARVGVPHVDLGVGKWAWLQLYGPLAELMVGANCAANVALFTSATAGTLDDASSSQKKIKGIWLTTARGSSAGTAPAFLNFPYYDL
ncbi:MAG: hypothetical protein OXH38_11850 [Chloroflexi bacterium]|nr:hypothetical protein [Chloroflexota bacterium]